MKLRNQIINFIINKSKDEKFNAMTISKYAISSTFFLDPLFKTDTANYFIQRHWAEIVDFKNNFMEDDNTDIFSHPDIFLQHLVRLYARILLAAIDLENTTIIDEYFIRKLENLMRV